MDANPDYEDIRYEVEDGRARITLARPKTHNAMTPRLLEELEHALWEADDRLRRAQRDPARGRAPRSVPATTSRRSAARSGPAIERAARHDDDIWLIEQNNRRIRTLWEMHKPSIAQVHGNCLAGGTDLALACDIVIAAEDARIGFPAARTMGALPNNLWMYHCGPQWAKRLQLTGDSVTGADAEKIGLVMKAVPADVLEDEVEGLADRFSLIDPDLLAANKRITNLALELMGAQTLQRLAGENDARAHRSQAVRDYGRNVREHGLKETLRRGTSPSVKGYARVGMPRGSEPRRATVRPRIDRGGGNDRMSRKRNPERAAVRIARKLVSEIRRRRLRPGTQLDAEHRMVEEFGVARATVREALRFLELQGALRIKAGPGGGPVVSAPGADHLASVLSLHLQFADASFRSVVRGAPLDLSGAGGRGRGRTRAARTSRPCTRASPGCTRVHTTRTSFARRRGAS